MQAKRIRSWIERLDGTHTLVLELRVIRVRIRSIPVFIPRASPQPWQRLAALTEPTVEGLQALMQKKVREELSLLSHLFVSPFIDHGRGKASPGRPA